MIPNRKPDEIGIVFSMKHSHYPVLVKSYRAETNVEDGTNILHPFSFCQQMQDLALPLGQLSYLFHAPPVFNTAHVSRQGNTGKFDRIDQGRLVVGLPRSFIGEKSRFHSSTRASGFECNHLFLPFERGRIIRTSAEKFAPIWISAS